MQARRWRKRITLWLWLPVLLGLALRLLGTLALAGYQRSLTGLALPVQLPAQRAV